MVLSRFTFLSLLFASSAALAAPAAAIPTYTSTTQMVSLNLQIQAKNKTVKSDLMMPFYQTGELEKKVGDKNFFIELNPRHGKNVDEINLEIKLSKFDGAKVFFKKEIVAKVNQESLISLHGMSMKVKPALN